MSLGGTRRFGTSNSYHERMARMLFAGLAVVILFSTTCDAVKAEGCPTRTEQLRLEQPEGSSLPDCRAYEQVSPVGKNELDAVGSVGLVQASPIGSSIGFFAVAPFPQTIGSAHTPSYIGVRSLNESDWSTQGIEALAPAGSVESVDGMTNDLTRTIIKVGSAQSGSQCEPRQEVCGGLNNINYYLRNNITGSVQFLANTGNQLLGFSDSTPDGSRVLFETEAQLVPEAEPGVNLYEWNEAKPPDERISLAGVLPGGLAPKGGAFGGPGGPAVERTPPLNSKWHFYSQNALSADGLRVFFSDIETGIIYMREPEAEPAVTVPISKGPAYWRAATPSGAYVLYTEGEELYRFNVNAAKEEPLTGDSKEGKPGVLGVLGISNDASYTYFVALGRLAENLNGNNEEAEKGVPNLYEWHNGETIFITKLPEAEEADWQGWSRAEERQEGPSGGEKSSRITPDGTEILFSSTATYANYSNNGLNEFYLYSAQRPLAADNPVCISCNPERIPALHSAYLTRPNRDLTAVPAPRNAFLTHNLSDSGRRVFFETDEALVPGDVNSQTDIYEWEMDGEGSCKSKTQDDGCLFLISTGQSPQHSYFGDASADGNDVFFFTRQSLAGQDQDNNADLYDARVDGGILSQNPPLSPVPCAEETACRNGASSSVPSVFGLPYSTMFSGTGNLPPQPPPSLPMKHAKKRPAQVKAKRLSKALRVCKTKPKARRKRCEASARKRYGKGARPNGSGGHR